MSKGDKISVATRDGNVHVILATKRGRRLQVARTATWLHVQELTQTGRPTGNELRAQMKEVAAYAVELHE